MRRIFLSAALLIVTTAACDKNLSWGLNGPSSGGGGASGGSSGVASGGGGGQPFAATATSTPDAWKRYDLRGVQLGMPRKQLVSMGFTCGDQPSSRCYKIMDDRCKTGTCTLKKDEWMSEQWFELNGTKTSLEYITCATTESDAALVWDCRLQVARQLLSTDSALGKALIGKYGMYTQQANGQPNDHVGGGEMWWANPKGGPSAWADCDNAAEPDACKITITDYGIRTMERDKQVERDQQKMRANQPTTAPSL